MKTILKKLGKKVLFTGVLLATSTEMAWAQNAASITIDQPDKGITNLGKLVSASIQAAIVIAALLTFAFLIWGGIQWLTSGGDKTAYEAARGRITAALIGLAIVAAAWALMEIIGIFFGVDIVNDGIDIGTAAGQ